METTAVRSKIVKVDIFEGERFLATIPVKVKLTYDFDYSDWVINEEDMQEALNGRFPEMRKSGRYRFLI